MAVLSFSVVGATMISLLLAVSFTPDRSNRSRITAAIRFCRRNYSTPDGAALRTLPTTPGHRSRSRFRRGHQGALWTDDGTTVAYEVAAAGANRRSVSHSPIDRPSPCRAVAGGKIWLNAS